MPKLISIIVPCYNVEQYIDRCVNSLINQTIGLDKLELIFVNDASPDRTIDKLFEYEKQYPNDIVIIDSEENMKQGGAKNLGLRYASADYVSFVDSDDWLELTMYEKLYEKAIQYDCEIVSGCVKRVPYEGIPMGRTGEDDKFYIIENETQRKALLINNIGSCLGKLFKKEFLTNNNIYYLERITYEDNYMSYLSAMYVKRIYFLEEYFYNYYNNLESTVVKKNSTHHYDRLITETIKIEELKARNLFDQYHDEIEYSFISLFYFNSLHIFFTRLTTVPPEILNYMKETVLALFPNYKSNTYLSSVHDIYKVLLKTIDTEISDNEWARIAKEYQKLDAI
ncbi:MAG TPA: glycosyltransferase family 2 protein [Mobilitalea sp.]|nr:glycosyltransferase family 2 protein [Mobilitalea sp.]